MRVVKAFAREEYESEKFHREATDALRELLRIEPGDRR